MARTMVVRRAAALTLALLGLSGAFVAGTGASAHATDGQAILAGLGNVETASTGLTNGNYGTAFIATTYTGNPSSAIWGQAINGAAASGNGVIGESEGNASSGVYGQNDNAGYGVAGRAADGTGVLADSANGTALRVSGKVELSRSGKATITGTSGAPLSSVVVSSVALSAKSMVVATIQKNVAGVWIQAAVPNVAGGSVTIYLNKAVTKSVPVAWMVIERP